MILNKRDFYFPSEIALLLEQYNKPKSSFYRLVKQGVIKKRIHDNQEVYDGQSVSDFLENNKKVKTYQRKVDEKASPLIKEELATPVTMQQTSSGATDWIQESDLPYVFGLDYELYGLDATVSPLITRFWWLKNARACRILFNEDNRKDVWGALTIIPMEEETIFRILKGDLEEKNIIPDQILTYESGKVYNGYVASLAIRPERTRHLRQLIQSTFDYWCDQYPDVQLRQLYAYALGGEGSDGMRLIRKLFFAPLYERNNIKFENAWELRLDRYNPSLLIERFRDCVRHKQSRISSEEAKKPVTTIIMPPVEQRTDKAEKQLKHVTNNFIQVASRSVAAGRFRTAKLDTDFQAIVEIGDLIFGASNVPDETLVKLFRSWWAKNHEVFHVMEVNGEINGFASLLPLKQEKIDEIIQERVRMSGIQESDIQEFEPGKPVDLFVHVLGVRPSSNINNSLKHAFGSQLIEGVVDMFTDLGRRGIEIRSVHARSNTHDGIGLSRHLGFKQIPPPPGVTKDVFLLDVQDSPLLIEYQKLLAEYKSSQDAAKRI